MGVSVRQKGKDWYIFIRHNGDRAAKKYESQEEAEDVAKAVRHAITLGQFDIAALKKQREAKPDEERPLIPTLKEYYERFSKECLRLTVGESTQDIYDNAFHNHLLCTSLPENPD